jgi:hypothetical protein
MAQETAGTIGIPVIKNEVLPYLVDYAKRRERQQYLDAQLKQKQAELDAKKRDAAPEGLPGVEAGYAAPLIDQTVIGYTKGMMDLAKQGASQGELNRVSRVYKQDVESKNNFNKLLTTNITNESKRLRELGLNATPQNAEEYFSVARQDPNFFQKDHQTEYAKWLRSKPAQNIAPGTIGNLLRSDSGKLGTVKKTYETPGGVTETFEHEKLFMPEETDVPGRPDLKRITANKVDYGNARTLLNKRPELQALAKDWITDKKAELALTPAFKLKPKDAVTDQELDDAATKEFFNAAFPLAGNEVYALRREQGRKGGGSGSKKYDDISVGFQTFGYTSFYDPYGKQTKNTQILPEDAPKIAGEIPVISVNPTQEGKLDITLPVGTTYIDLSSKPLTGFKQVNKRQEVTAGSFPGGYSTVKAGRQLVAPAIGYNATAKEDIILPDGTKIRKNGQINPAFWPQISFNQINLSPGVYGTTKEMQFDMGEKKYQNPSVASESVFVPQNKLPGFFNNAKDIMKEKGMDLNTEMSKIKKQYEAKFGGGKTSAPQHW